MPASPTTARADRYRMLAMLLAIAVALAVVAALRIAIGPSALGFPSGENAGRIMESRFFRLGLGLIVGAALSISGVSLQALLRNPLAEPFILGLSTGAAAGYMAEAFVRTRTGVHLFGLGPLAGASLTMLVVFLAGRRRGVIDPLGLLLTGVVLGTMNAAVVMVFNYLAPDIQGDLARWMMGYLSESTSQTTLFAIAGLTLAGLALLLFVARSMDIATLSEAEAESLGVHLARLRSLLFIVASVLAAGSVVLAGPIAFVGLICPHLARLLFGPRHGPLLIASAMLGAALVVAADCASSLIALEAGYGSMPIGIFTAFVGGPVFLWMLRPQLGRGNE
ncbi:MAG: FecCD family ABC transporter permease [Phycisphaeraceae bacterium]